MNAAQRAAHEANRKKTRAALRAKGKPKQVQERRGISVSVRVSEDPKMYYREYARAYYEKVRKYDQEYIERNRQRTAHAHARKCPYPVMYSRDARECGLTLIGPSWFWRSPPGTDAQDAAQDRALEELEIDAAIAEAKRSEIQLTAVSRR